jgi:hypothetical protein
MIFFKNRRFGGTSASIIRARRIGELGKALAVTSNRSTLQRNTTYIVFQLLVTANVVPPHELLLIGGYFRFKLHENQASANCFTFELNFIPSARMPSVVGVALVSLMLKLCVITDFLK